MNTVTTNDYFNEHTFGIPIKGVVFIFGGWRVAELFYRPGIRAMNKLGYACVLYRPKTGLISPRTTFAEIVKVARWTERDVDRKIATYRTQNLDLEYISMGISFGTMFAMQAAKANDMVTKVVLTAPFGDFEEHVKLWENHRYFKKVLAHQRAIPSEPGEVLNEVGSLKNIELLRNKQIYICYGDQDVTVHTKVTEGLIAHLKQHNIFVTEFKAHGGHYTGIFKNYARLMKSRAFL